MAGGGVTFGGGEPLIQSDFIHEVCKLMSPAWNKRIETSLNVPWRYVEPLLQDLDEWIIDIKDADGRIYEKYTGTTNTNMRNNIFKLADMVKPRKLRVRVPRIPGYNDEDKINESVIWVKDVMKLKAEIIDYIVPAEITPLTD